MSASSEEFEQIAQEAELFELELELNKMIANYYEINPVGKISEDGRYIMQENGMWHGRCTLVPYTHS